MWILIQLNEVILLNHKLLKMKEDVNTGFNFQLLSGSKNGVFAILGRVIANMI
jgi:hypothetical protein